MGFQLCTGATLQCTFGVAASALTVLPTGRILTGVLPAANSSDHIPLVNILPFGTCTSLSNPTVSAATSAALGVLTPMPCIPVTSSPWIPGVVKVLHGGVFTIDDTCMLMCQWGGVIKPLSPGQTTLMES